MSSRDALTTGSVIDAANVLASAARFRQWATSSTEVGMATLLDPRITSVVDFSSSLSMRNGSSEARPFACNINQIRCSVLPTPHRRSDMDWIRMIDARAICVLSVAALVSVLDEMEVSTPAKLAVADRAAEIELSECPRGDRQLVRIEYISIQEHGPCQPARAASYR
jgi:hypothetical protein